MDLEQFFSGGGDPFTPIIVAVIAGIAVIGAIVATIVGVRRRQSISSGQRDLEGRDTAVLPGVGDDSETPRDSATRTVTDIQIPDTIEELQPAPVKPELDKPKTLAERLIRFRERLAGSQSALSKALLAILSTDSIDEDVWEDLEDTLLMADVGADASAEIVEKVRERVRVLGTKDPAAVKGLLREELIAVIDPAIDRNVVSSRTDGKPAVVMVVGVNGTGKTTTVGKLARVLVSEEKSVVLGAADTFRAAAADQLTTWGNRVGLETIRSEKDGGDPASVAFEAVQTGVEQNIDTVLIDTAGRLQNKVGLMDELGKIERVSVKARGIDDPLDEVLLVLDATTGQNGLQQAKVFSEVTKVSGIVLSKLDGTAKGGIVVAVQRSLGVPVKLVGIGEGPDDLAPFVVEDFVDALLD